MDKIQTLSLVPTCPICHSTQFSVVLFNNGVKPADIDNDVIGLSDCRGCGRDFLVKISPELKALASR